MVSDMWETLLVGYNLEEKEEELIANSTVIIYRPLAVLVFFLALWSVNVKHFEQKGINYTLVMGLEKDEIVSHGSIARAFVLLASIVFIFASIHVHIASVGTVACSSIVLCYTLVGMLVFSSRINAMQGARGFLRRHLANCIWPPTDRPTPFVEVLVADGLTSLSKVFYDLAIVGCIVPNLALRNSNLETLPEVESACVHNSFPFVCWSVPYIIRACQCLITAKHTTDKNARFLHYANTCKYMSVFPVILFANLLHIYPGSPWAEHWGNLHIMAMIINCCYCYTWDIIMDWGLLQPDSKNYLLRDILLYQHRSPYYVAAFADMIGRVFWATKWVPGWSSLDEGYWASAKATALAELCEVLRRCMWNLYRVEWQCIKVDPEVRESYEAAESPRETKALDAEGPSKEPQEF